MTANAGAKQARGRFRKGQSGNPAGKAPGTRHRVTILAEQLMQADEKGVVEAVLTAAKAGDMTAARLVLDRIAPVRKGRPVTLSLPPTETAADVSAAMSSIVAQMAAGDLTADEASTIVGVIEAKHRALSVSDMERRMQDIEAKLAGKQL